MLCRTQEINCSFQGCDDPPITGYNFNTGKMYAIPALRPNIKSKTVSGVIVDFFGDKVLWKQEIHFVRFLSFETEWLEFGGASGWEGSPDVVIAVPRVSDDFRRCLTVTPSPDKRMAPNHS